MTPGDVGRRKPYYDLESDTVPSICHRGVFGMVHYYDVAEKYDASAIYHDGADAYFLQCEAGGTLTEAQKNWEKTVDAFFDRMLSL